MMNDHIVVENTQREWAWPSGELGPKFGKWLVEFDILHHRQPNVPEMVEWAYQKGLKDGKASADSQSPR